MISSEQRRLDLLPLLCPIDRRHYTRAAARRRGGANPDNEGDHTGATIHNPARFTKRGALTGTECIVQPRKYLRSQYKIENKPAALTGSRI